MRKNLIRLYVCAIFLISFALRFPKSFHAEIERKNMVEYSELKSNYETWFSNKSDEMQINYAKLNKPNRRRKRCDDDNNQRVERVHQTTWTETILTRHKAFFPIITIVRKADSYVIFIKWQTKWCSMTSGILTSCFFFYLNKMNKFNFFIFSFYWENSFSFFFPSDIHCNGNSKARSQSHSPVYISKSNLKCKKKFT